ncbi:hypothetical protein N7472_010002 [Penicillium cf. griseofulvum]|uniref:Uncharacterized protein n=1 Tax=Penicillium cf. griseofulvum TaxID=2972120 RepID=A0A9W9IVZ4_9EURO|nr:hypothetical protein N7472_010002 [Penicillium cf. griseofulvum]
MPPKKGQRKSMPARINKEPTLTPSRRSPRVPPPVKKYKWERSAHQNVEPYIRLSPRQVYQYSSRGTSPETPSSRRRTFQARPSRLSTVHTPALEAPATNPGSRRTRRTAALETPKQAVSDIDFPDSTGNWAIDQYMGSIESEGTVDGPSSPTSASDMRNSSRVRKPTMRALESFESYKKKPRRKNTNMSTPTVETPAPVATKVAKSNVSKKHLKTTRKSKRMTNLNMRKNAILIGFDIDPEVAGKKLYDLTVQALSPEFTLPLNFPAFWEQQRSEYFRLQDEEKYGSDIPTTKPTSPSDVDVDVDMINQDPPAPEIAPSPTPPTAVTSAPGILGYKKQSDTKVSSDGWIQTGYVNSSGEEVALIPEKWHPYFPPHTYGYGGLPYPRTSQQAEADISHSFAPLMGDRNLPSKATSPFVTENVEEEKAMALARIPAPAPAIKKTRGRKRRQTAAVDAADQPAAADPVATPGTGARKSQRRRRQTAPAPTTLSPTSPTSPPTTATKVQSSAPPTAVTPAVTEGDKPKVQRLRLTLKPETKTETSGNEASASKHAPAVQSPSSPAPSHVPSPASTNKRRHRRRRGVKPQ